MKTILNLRKPFKNHIVADEKFYTFCGLPFTIIEESLNALGADGFIEIIPPSIKTSYPIIRINQKAYTYFPDRQDIKFRFWISITISIIALLRPEITLLIKYIIKLCSQK